MRMIRCLFTLSVVVLLYAQAAEASIVVGTRNTLSIRNWENAIDTDGVGGLTVGDRFRGVFTTDTVKPDTSGPITPPVPEITGIFDTVVEHIIFRGVAFGSEFYNVLFGPSWAVGGLDALAGVAPGSGTMLVAFQDPANDFSETGSVAAAEASAIGGTLLGAYGMPLNTDGVVDPVANWGAVGNGYWFAEVSVPDLGAPGVGDTPLPLAPPTGAVSFGFGLTAISGVGALTLAGPYTPLSNEDLPITLGNPPGTTILANTLGGTTFFDIVGSSDVKPNTDPGSSGHYATASEDPTRLHPNPEPSSFLAFAGLFSALALGMARKRRRRAR